MGKERTWIFSSELNICFSTSWITSYEWLFFPICYKAGVQEQSVKWPHSRRAVRWDKLHPHVFQLLVGLWGKLSFTKHGWKTRVIVPNPKLANAKMSYSWFIVFQICFSSQEPMVGFYIPFLHNKCLQLIISILGDFEVSSMPVSSFKTGIIPSFCCTVVGWRPSISVRHKTVKEMLLAQFHILCCSMVL